MSPDTGESPLHVSVLHTENLECPVLRRLLAAGAHPNQQTQSGITSNSRHCPDLDADTPLHLAAAYGSESVVASMIDFLISAGADPSLRNSRGQTPLDLARERDPLGILRLLQSHPV